MRMVRVRGMWPAWSWQCAAGPRSALRPHLVCERRPRASPGWIDAGDDCGTRVHVRQRTSEAGVRSGPSHRLHRLEGDLRGGQSAGTLVVLNTDTMAIEAEADVATPGLGFIAGLVLGPRRRSWVRPRRWQTSPGSSRRPGNTASSCRTCHPVPTSSECGPPTAPVKGPRRTRLAWSFRQTRTERHCGQSKIRRARRTPGSTLSCLLRDLRDLRVWISLTLVRS